MARTYEPIASTTLGSDTATVTFGSGGTLPQTYTDFILVVVGRTTRTTSNSCAITFNGDTGNNYSYTILSGNGSSASSSRQSNQGAVEIGELPASTASEEGICTAQIQSATATTVNKTVLSASAVPGTLVRRFVGLWRSTSAITSITVSSPGYSLKSGMVLSLYGIKAA